MPNIYYVSKTGDNANDGLTIQTAKRTLWDSTAANGAFEAAADGDTIKFGDGVYSGAEIENAAGQGYLNCSKTLKFDSINPYGAKLAATGANAPIKVSGAYAGKTLSFGKIRMGGDGTNPAPSYGVWFNPSSGPATLDFTNLKVEESLSYGIYCTAANTVIVSLKDSGSEIHAGKSAVYAQTLGAASKVDINKTKCVIQDKATASPCIAIKATAAGCKAKVKRPEITVSYASNFPANIDRGVQILNIDNALILEPRITATTASSVGTIDAAVIDCDSATLSAHNGRIIGGTISPDTNGGIAAVIGHDTPNAADNLSNGGIIRGVKVNGGTKWIAGTGHAVMIGNCQDGLLTDNDIDGAGIGLLLKGTLRGKATGNRVRRVVDTGYSGNMEFKGATDSVFEGNEIYLDDSNGVAALSKLNGATQNTNCAVNGNTIVIRGTFSGQLAEIAAGDTVTFKNNVYAIAADAVMPANVATIGASNYATVDAFMAAADATGDLISDMPENDRPSGLWLEVAPGISLPI